MLKKGIACLVFFCLTGCGTIKENQTVSTKDNMGAVSNPAAEKCVRDGYQSEPVLENGVPVGYVCIDPETGKKCEIWKYFRGECKIR